MSDTSLPAAGPRQVLAECVLGGSLTLIAITVAHAALPDVTAAKPPPPRIMAAVQQVPAPPPALIAFAQPLPDGEVGSPFGYRQLPWEDHGRLHAGVDMIAPAPEPVRAAADGVVARIGTDPGYGRFVELEHAGGLKTRYGHLDRFAPGLAEGQALKSGDPVGRLGSTGTSTGLHLHFEVRDADDRPMNPELFLGRAFMTVADLPLKEARRAPRRVRIAYVSRIPKSKRDEMAAKRSAEAADEAEGAEAADLADPPALARHHPRHGRVYARFRVRSSHPAG